jgi:hypothetical protein
LAVNTFTGTETKLSRKNPFQMGRELAFVVFIDGSPLIEPRRSISSAELCGHSFGRCSLEPQSHSVLNRSRVSGMDQGFLD